ncbi:MAG: Transcriptional regulator, LuxR family [Labilithrix sp.]|jgi:DNA-binding CsgD family transcriptional regulator|nr:Transcriptional regulator, LuxR family [Labilithrix sp.]
MRRLERETHDKLRAVEEALANHSLDRDNIGVSLEALRELVDTDKVFLSSLAQRADGDDLTITRDAAVGCAQTRWRKLTDDFLRGRVVSWTGYDGLHPAPAQRDRVLRSADLAELTHGRSREVETLLYPRLGMGGEDTMRVLVCDGPVLLAWLGIVQPEPTTERQRELLTRLVPAFRRRLVFDRALGASTLTTTALAAALERVQGAAWVLAARGRLLHANAAGQARIDADPSGTRAALEACTAGRGEPRFDIVAIAGPNGDGGHIVIEKVDPAGARNVPDAAARLRLTPAQTRVLERVALGASNATIAAELGVAERTVEAHVTAILVKAQVSSRAALIVQVFRERRTR